MRWASVLLAVLLGGLGLLSLLGRASSMHGDDGVVWLSRGGILEAGRIEARGPAERAGIRLGDRLLSINDVTPSPMQSVRELLWGREGIPTIYRLSRGDGPQQVEVTPRADGDENRLYYFLFLVGAAGLVAGTLTFAKLPGEPAAPVLYALCSALFAVSALSPGGSGGLLDWMFYWGDLAGRLLLPPLIIHFMLRLEEPEAISSTTKSRRHLLYSPALLLLGLAILLIPLRGALAFANPVAAIRLKDRLELLYLGIYSLAAVTLLAARLWSCTRVRTRWRLRWVATSAAAGLLPLTLLYLLPQALGVRSGTLGELSLLPVAVVPLGFAAAIFQERAVDLDRSLRAVTRWLVGGAVLLAGGVVLSWLLARLPGALLGTGVLTEVILPIVTSAALAAAFYPALGRRIDRLLARPAIRISRLLLDLGEDINGEVRLEALAKKLTARIESAFAVRPVRLLVEQRRRGSFLPVSDGTSPGNSDTGWDLSEGMVRSLSARELVLLESAEDGFASTMVECMRKAGYRYLFPLVVQAELRAMLLVGPHRDGSAMDGEELDAMTALASQAARGVEAARLYRDIEERIHREERLRRESESILESTRIGILLTDKDGKITAANRAAVGILGHPSPVGAWVGRLLPRGLLMLMDRSIREDREAGSADRVFRFSLAAADGPARVVNVCRSPVGGDRSTGMVYTIDDVSEEVRREEKMLRQDHLAAMGLLASQVAHEVNTPLTGIASYAQMLMARMKARLPEMELLRKIESQAFRAAGIADSVLNFARRKEVEPPQVLDPGPVVAESLALFEPFLKGKRVRLTLERAPSLPDIRAQRGKIQQVVLNLLMNAAQALPAGGEIRLAMDRDGESVRIRVSDNGVGIPAADLRRIFEPFYSTHDDGKGTGLGLSVVQRIVQEHGGDINVESVEGAGSTFTVSFPAILEQTGEMARGA